MLGQELLSQCCAMVWCLSLQGHTAPGWARTMRCSYREPGKEEGLSSTPQKSAIPLHSFTPLLPLLPCIHLSLFCCISPLSKFSQPLPTITQPHLSSWRSILFIYFLSLFLLSPPSLPTHLIYSGSRRLMFPARSLLVPCSVPAIPRAIRGQSITEMPQPQ